MRRPLAALLAITLVVVGIVIVLRTTRDDGPAVDAAMTTPTTTSTDPTTPAPSSTTTTPVSTSTSTIPELPSGIEVCDLYGSIDDAGQVVSDDLVEASGLAVSRTAAGVLWSHNDSRGGAILHAFDPEGRDLGAFSVPDAFALDWEDIGAGPGPDGEGAFLYIGDMGDNFGIRDGIATIFRVPDMDPSTMDGAFPSSVPIVLDLTTGAMDAEALFVDPVDPAIYIVTKSRTEAFVYRGTLEPGNQPQPMTLVTTLFLDAEVSAADISPDGAVIAFRGYDTVWMWHRSTGESVADALEKDPCLAPSPNERQGESIALDATWSYFTVSEGSLPTIHYVPTGR